MSDLLSLVWDLTGILGLELEREGNRGGPHRYKCAKLKEIKIILFFTFFGFYSLGELGSRGRDSVYKAANNRCFEYVCIEILSPCTE